MTQRTVVIAKCRFCDRRTRVDVPTDEHGYVTIDGRLMTAKDAVPHLVWCAGSDVEYASRRGGPNARYADGSLSCRVPHGPMYGRPIKARLAPDVPCDDRCTHATGETCRCSCGGANHGIDA